MSNRFWMGLLLLTLTSCEAPPTDVYNDHLAVDPVKDFSAETFQFKSVTLFLWPENVDETTVLQAKTFAQQISDGEGEVAEVISKIEKIESRFEELGEDRALWREAYECLHHKTCEQAIQRLQLRIQKIEQKLETENNPKKREKLLEKKAEAEQELQVARDRMDDLTDAYDRIRDEANRRLGLDLESLERKRETLQKTKDQLGIDVKNTVEKLTQIVDYLPTPERFFIGEKEGGMPLIKIEGWNQGGKIQDFSTELGNIVGAQYFPHGARYRFTIEVDPYTRYHVKMARALRDRWGRLLFNGELRWVQNGQERFGIIKLME